MLFPQPVKEKQKQLVALPELEKKPIVMKAKVEKPEEL
jgi:hypothetical protein